MERYDENEIRNFLLLYKVKAPSPELVSRTKHLMQQEMTSLSAAASWQKGWIYLLVSASIIMSMSIFYTLTVGTILSLTLPAYMLEFLRQSLIAFIAAGGCFITGMIMVFFFKQFECSRAGMC